MNVVAGAIGAEHIPAQVPDDPAHVRAKPFHNFRAEPRPAFLGRKDKMIIQLRV